MSGVIGLSKLRELAGKATPGPWCVENPLDETLSIVEAGKEAYEWRFIANCTLPDEDDHDFTSREVKANAAYIAALDPHTVLTLLDIAEKARDVIECQECPAPIDGVKEAKACFEAKQCGCTYGLLCAALKGITQ